MCKKILVVDDSADTRDMMAKLLELEKYKVITAGDGHTGINLAKTEHPDLIITDINMPNLDGIQMIGMIRGTGELGEVPILAITAYGSSAAADAISAGANRALTKPVEFDFLIDGIKQLLRQSNSQANSTGNGTGKST